jgi:hypothetical protein
MHGSHRSYFSFASVALLTHRGPGVWQIFIYPEGGRQLFALPRLSYGQRPALHTGNNTAKFHTNVLVAHPIITFCKSAPWYISSSESGRPSEHEVSGTGIGFWSFDIGPIDAGFLDVFL